MVVPPQENVLLNQSLPAKPFMPEPQNDSCWLLKRKGIYQNVMDITCPKYYHLNLLCLKKRRPNVKVTREIIKCHEDAAIAEETEACLFLTS